jgi:hypothetical protein
MKLCYGCGFFMVGGGLLLLTGCSSVLPTTQVTTKSAFTNYAEVQAAFDRIVPYQTHVGDLKSLGLDPASTAGMKLLTYVEVTKHFMPNPAITKEDLHPAVRDCIDARENGHAYQIDLSDLRSNRYGNTFLDVLGFKRRTHETGWRFNGLILTTNGVVVYKLTSGEPVVSTDLKRVKPLGPLQELDSAALGAISR